MFQCKTCQQLVDPADWSEHQEWHRKQRIIANGMFQPFDPATARPPKPSEVGSTPAEGA